MDSSRTEIEKIITSMNNINPRNNDGEIAKSELDDRVRTQFMA